VPYLASLVFGFQGIAIGWLFYTVWRCEEEYPYIHQDIPPETGCKTPAEKGAG
jgi:hypothetical protein